MADRIWVGAYTADMGGSADGVMLLTSLADGSLVNAGVAAETASPSALLLVDGVLYAANEGVPAVTAWRVDDTGLTLIGEQDVDGESPCALAAFDGVLAVACYGSGSVNVYPLASDGSVGPASQSLAGKGSGPREEQDGPHAHAVVRLDESTALTTDLGADLVHVHHFAAGELTRVDSIAFPAGTGPRDVTLVAPDTLLVLGELSGEVFLVRREASGFVVSTGVTLPGREDGDHAASLAIHGGFVYSGLRGSDRISVLTLGADGISPLTSVEAHGSGPRHLLVDGEHLRVANQLSQTVDSFRLGANGIPEFASSLPVPSPTYLVLD